MDALETPFDPALALNQTKRAPAIPKNMDPKRAHEVAVNMEAMFLSEMLRPMFDEMSSAPPFGGGPGEDMWRSLLVDEYGRAIAKTGGIGIADTVMDQILRTQEGANP